MYRVDFYMTKAAGLSGSWPSVSLRYRGTRCVPVIVPRHRCTWPFRKQLLLPVMPFPIRPEDLGERRELPSGVRDTAPVEIKFRKFLD